MKRRYKVSKISASAFMSFFIFVLAIGYGFAEEKAVVKKDGIQVYFDKNAYSKKEREKYIDYVWQQWVMKELKEADIKLLGISKEKIALIEVDLNGDSYKDFIATVIDNDYYCGKFGADCEFRLFVSKSQGGFHHLTSCMSIFHARPVYILNKKVSGLKKIIVNDKFILEFNGKEYCNNK